MEPDRSSELITGSSDPVYAAWRGNILERAPRDHNELRTAPISAVRLKELKTTHAMPGRLDAMALTRAKVEPMVVGLSPRAEQDVVLVMMEKAVVFLTSGNVETVLLEESFNHSAWTHANLYLAGSGAELLSHDAPNLVGLSQNTTCYVSPPYFHEDDRFADFVVHEAAHVVHNCKRVRLGLRETRSKVWLLDIEYRKRETFAYSCEACARTATRWRTSSARPSRRGTAGRSCSRNVPRLVNDPASFRKGDHNEEIA